MTVRLALVVSSTSDDRGGVVAARMRHLLEAGWDARLFCKGESWAREPALSDTALQGRVQIAARARRNSNPFRRQFRNLRPDLIHFHSGWMAWKGIRRGGLSDSPSAARTDRPRVVVSFREDGQDLRVPDLELLWRRADLLLFRQETSLERAVERGCPRDRAEILEPPVPEVDWDAGERSDNGPLRILSVGSLLWEQGYEHSIHAVRLLLDMGVPCDYRIVGDGDHVQAVAFARYQLGLVDHVHLQSPDGSDRLTGELRSADVILDPAVADTVPSTALAAAQAHGIPYVATKRSSHLPEGAGLVVPRRDPRALAEALALLARDPGLRARMGRTGRGLAPPPTPADHLARLESLYRRALAASS